MGHKPGDDFGGVFWDAAEECPGFYIIQREIGKAVDGKAFFINDEETKKPVRLDAIDYKYFLHYYKIWENFHYFGLPHADGWYCEREWLLEFLKTFENVYKRVKYFLEEKAIRKGSGVPQISG